MDRLSKLGKKIHPDSGESRDPIRLADPVHLHTANQDGIRGIFAFRTWWGRWIRHQLEATGEGAWRRKRNRVFEMEKKLLGQEKCRNRVFLIRGGKSHLWTCGETGGRSNDFF